MGAGDHAGANAAAVQSIGLAVVISIAISIVLILADYPLVKLFGAGDTADLAVEYGNVVFAGTILLLLSNIGYAILRLKVIRKGLCMSWGHLQF